MNHVPPRGISTRFQHLVVAVSRTSEGPKMTIATIEPAFVRSRLCGKPTRCYESPESKSTEPWRDLHQRQLSDPFEVVIALSDDFYREIASHLIRDYLEAVKVLSGVPAALDPSMWLSYRCFVAAGRESIPLFGARN